MMLTDLADVCRKAGFNVVEQKGWKTRGHGTMSDIRTITCHHTANGGAKGNAPSLNVVQNGRPGLDGPLAHIVLGRDSTVYVVAAGLCYHAGVSRDNDYTNSHAIGIEAEAKGVGTWDGADIEDYAYLAYVLAKHYGVPNDHILGHKETCSPVGRKSDPLLNMSTLRKLAKEGNMNLTLSNTDIDRIATAVVKVLTDEKIVPNKVLNEGDKQGANWTVAGVLAAADQKADLQGRTLNQILAAVTTKEGTK